MQLRITGAFARSVGGDWLPTRCAPARPARRTSVRVPAQPFLLVGLNCAERRWRSAKPPFKRTPVASWQAISSGVNSCDMPDRDKTASLTRLIVAAPLGTPCALSCSSVVM